MDGGVYALTVGGSPGFGVALPAAPIVRNGTVGVMHIASASTWEGHPNGSIEFTAELFDAMVSRFQARPDRALSMDYFHGSARKDATPEQAAASGWIRSLWRAGDGEHAQLWATVEFTSRAAGMIRDGELLYCSPEFSLRAADVRTGEKGPELYAVALTNRPFQNNLAAIALSREAIAMALPTDDDDKKKPDDAAPPASDKPSDKPGDDAPPVADDAPPDLAALPENGAVAPEQDASAAVMGAIAKELGVDSGRVAATMQGGLSAMTKAVAALMALEDPSTAPASMARMERIEADRATDAQTALLSRNAHLEAELQRRDDEAAALKLARAKDHVASLVKLGRVHVDPVRQEDAVFMFSSDWARGDRTYADQIVHVGVVASPADDKTQGVPKLDELTEAERGAVKHLSRHTGATEQEAIQLVVSTRKG